MSRRPLAAFPELPKPLRNGRAGAMASVVLVARAALIGEASQNRPGAKVFRALGAHSGPQKPARRGFLQILLAKLLISLILTNEFRQISPNPAKDSFGGFEPFQGLRIWSGKFPGAR
jgi:hypothetical protein